MAFENNHDQVNNIPFELQLLNIGKILGGWAQKLGLNKTRSNIVSRVSLRIFLPRALPELPRSLVASPEISVR
jgi:hypothetical protein